MPENNKNPLDSHADKLCRMMSELAEDLKDILVADIKIMRANLNYEYAKKMESLQKLGNDKNEK